MASTGDVESSVGGLDWIPEPIWQLPLPILLIALLSLGIFVTKREHRNMTLMMEYFKGIVEKRDETIKTQAEALKEYGTIAPLLSDIIKTIRNIANERRE